MIILGHPTHSDAPVHSSGFVFRTSSQGPSRNAAMFNKLHSKCCPAQNTANKNRSWCDELKRGTLIPSRKHVVLSSLRQLSKFLIRATPLSKGAHPSQVPLATPTPVWHFLGWVAHASVWSSNCLSGTCDAQCCLGEAYSLKQSEAVQIRVPVDHCACGAQLHELLNIQTAQGYPSNKMFDPKPFIAKRLQGEDRGQRGTGGVARLPPAYAPPVPVKIWKSLCT